MSDYRVEVKIRNERVLKALRGIGHNPSSFAKERNLSIGRMCAIAAMTAPAKRRDGMWHREVTELADAANIMPEDLFTPDQIDGKKKSNASFVVSENQLKIEAAERERLFIGSGDPEGQLCARDLAGRLFSDLVARSPRYAKIFAMRMEGVTLEEIGQEFGVSKHRISQIEKKSERLMREFAEKRYGVKELGDIFGG